MEDHINAVTSLLETLVLAIASLGDERADFLAATGREALRHLAELEHAYRGGGGGERVVPTLVPK